MRLIITGYILLLIHTICVSQTTFTPIVIDDNLPGTYQVSVADINNDGKPDIAGLSPGGVYWYENPSWKKYPITTTNTSKNIDLAFHDIDNDGLVEMALAYNFDLGNSTIGSVGIMQRQDDLSEQWQLSKLVDEPTAHRLRWADINRDGQSELVIVPIIGEGSTSPEYNQTPARQSVIFLSPNFKRETFTQRFFDITMHLTHGMFIWHLPMLNQESVLIAGEEGVKKFTLRNNDWDVSTVCSGAPIEAGRTGSSEIAVGHIQDQKLFFTTIEPWHGHQVVVYVSDEDDKMQRTVIDDTFVDGHALACADFDKDGQDEIIAGYRGKGYAVYLYDYDNETKKWLRMEVDKGGLAAQGFFVADINQDGWLDFVGGGGSTKNVKLYLNHGGN